jgi:hypothetical protein
MPGATSRGFPFPLGTEEAAGAPQIESLARAIDLDVTGMIAGGIGRGTVFATPAARDAAIPSPTAGMTCYVTSLKQSQVHSGGAWVPTGGTLPQGSVVWGTGGPFAPGSWTVFGHTPTTTSALGGMTVNPATGALTITIRGMYAVSIRFAVSGFAAPSTVAAAAFIDNVEWIQGGSLYVPTSVAVTSETSFVSGAGAGQVIRPAIYAFNAGTLGVARMTVQYLADNV